MYHLSFIFDICSHLIKKLFIMVSKYVMSSNPLFVSPSNFIQYLINIYSIPFSQFHSNQKIDTYNREIYSDIGSQLIGPAQPTTLFFVFFIFIKDINYYYFAVFVFIYNTFYEEMCYIICNLIYIFINYVSKIIEEIN